jgi:hypothetical protein
MKLDKRVLGTAPYRGKQWHSAALAAVMGLAATSAYSQAALEPGLDAAPAERLCTAGFNTDYGWFSTSGLLGVIEFPGLLQQGVCVPDGFTSAALSVQLGQQNGQLTLPLAEEVAYRQNPTTGSPGVSVALAEPALCEDYFTSASGEATWDFSIVDANGVTMITNVRGVASLDYNLNSGALVPAMVGSYGQTGWLRCYSALAANAGADPISPTDPDLIHSDGFEDPVVPSVAPNLRVDFLNASADAPLAGDVIEQSSISGSSVEFTVRVSNIGTVDATDVRVREFVPTVSAGLRPIVKRLECVDQGNSGAACSNGVGSSPFRQLIGTLPVGEHRDFKFKRQVCRDNGATCVVSSSDEAIALIQVAAFASPTAQESNYADNSRALRVKIVDNIQVTYRVSTDGSTANTSGGSLVASAPGCTNAGGVVTCPPGTTGLAFTANANANFTFTGFSAAACGVASGVGFTGGLFTTTTASSCTVTANFRTRPVVSLNPFANGTINSTNPQTVHYGDGNPATTADNAVFVVTPNPGWSVTSVTGCSSVSHANNGNGTWTITVENVQATCALTVGLSQAQYTVSAVVLPGSDGFPHGTIFGQSSVVVGYHANGVSFSFNAEDSTYTVESASDTCGGGLGYAHPVVPNRYVYEVNGGVISSDCQVQVKFERIRHDVTIDPSMTDALANGHIEFIASGTTDVIDPFNAKVVHGSNVSVRMVPKAGYHYVGNSLTGSAACHSIGGDATGPVAEDATANIDGWLGPIDGLPAGTCVIAAAFAPNTYTVRLRLADSEDGSAGTIACHSDFLADCEEILMDEEDEDSPVKEVVISNVLHGAGNNVKVVITGEGAHIPWIDPNGCGFQAFGAPTYRSGVVTGNCLSTVEFVQ